MPRLAVVAAIALAPDIIDKTLHYGFAPAFANGNVRNFAHSGVFTVAFSMALLLAGRFAFKLRWRQATLLALLAWCHPLLDEMWKLRVRAIWTWPFSGWVLPSFDNGGVHEHLWRNLRNGHVVVGELVGAAYLAWVYRGQRLKRRVPKTTT